MVLVWGDCSRHIFTHFSELNVTLPSFQSILGLCFFSHGSLMIISEFPIVMQCSFIFSQWLLMINSTLVSWVTGPLAISLPSTAKTLHGIFFLSSGIFIYSA
jgi:hypothetical protein